ncbi:hypothetical protein HPSA50_1414 [Helicobacter pylori SouthAfrica50]|uniref:Uncharacterized protein n=1 Tax=Helicobacter pylori SouthAfrica50 TaxID=1352357 RepID=T2S922_HELPX|nr:hypothetical protein HPSA50_1414 [Helicobacter pylori SouthAfrica50]
MFNNKNNKNNAKTMRKIVKKLGRSFKTFMFSKKLVKNSKTRALKS